MFKLSPKFRFYFKSWVHGAIATEVYALGNFLLTVHGHFTVKTFLTAAAYALLAPITRAIAKTYSVYAIKYPWLKPFAHIVKPWLLAKFVKPATATQPAAPTKV